MKPFSPPPQPSQSSKKRGSPRSDSPFMDPEEVVEIPPPPSFRRKIRSSEKKPIIIHDVVDIEEDDDSVDAMIIDVDSEMKDSGSTLKNNSAKDKSKAGSSKNSGPSSHNLVDDGFDLSHYDFAEVMNTEDMAMVQALLDSLDFPTGVEASVPWFSDDLPSKAKAYEGSSSSGHLGGGSSSLFGSVDASVYQNFGQPSLTDYKDQMKLQASLNSRFPKAAKLNQSGPSAPSVGVNGKPSRWGPPSVPSVGAKGKPSRWGPPANAKYGGAGTFPTPNHQSLYQASGNVLISSLGPQSGAPPPFFGDDYYDDQSIPFYDIPTPVNVKNVAGSSSYPNNVIGITVGLSHSHSPTPAPSGGVDVSPQEILDMRKNLKAVNEEDILNKFKLFKKFDTVEDFSNHHYAKTVVKQPSKSWAKKIQDEWRILENDLPDTIFVRVCETRMDLMRAVIIGAEGTPYHDGLFFFDIQFPATYPNVPPKVNYHAGGLRLNPNLYNCGKVCLSLLNTWDGRKDERWLPRMSTMLQVLVSIQALILNQNPYFNEPGYANLSGKPQGDRNSRNYNENTFILSLRTMMFKIKTPPKPFEDFVVGHFFQRAHDILVACRAYVDGAQVGCLVKGGVQDVDEGQKSGSENFRGQVAQCANLLIKELTLLGVKDCEKFLINTTTVKKTRAAATAANTPKTKSKFLGKILTAFS